MKKVLIVSSNYYEDISNNLLGTAIINHQLDKFRYIARKINYN